MAHKSEEELLEKLKSKSDLIDTKYNHYKDKSKIYVIRDIVLIEVDETIGIVYSGEDTPELKWLRSFENFFEEIVFEDRIVKRFVLIKY